MYQSTMTDQDEPGPPAVSKEGALTITRQSDGTISVEGPGMIGPRIPKTGEFDENLAGLIDDTGSALADKLIDYCRVDKESRKDWEEREKRALQMLGIEDTIKPKDSKSPGMNSVTHPMMMEAAVRFSSNAITEIFPATGPCKTKILGAQTRAKVQQSERIEMFCNYYLTEVDREYFADTDQMLFYLSMAGSAFRKGGQNWITGMPEMRYVKATNFIAPYAGTDLKSMPRYCHEFTMTGDDIRRAIASGMFADVQLPKGNSADASHAPTSDTADGRLAVMHDDDELYTMLEYHIDLELKGDEKAMLTDVQSVRPYLVIVEKDSAATFLVRRNWRERDEKFQKRMWFAHHKYLPGLGFYGFGLPHVIGSLGNAASGAVNALLDASQAATFQGGFKTREGKSIAGELRMQPGVWIDVDATYEDISKSFYTPPAKEPSPALFKLLEELVDAGQRFAGTSDAAVGDASNMGPVGTTIALIEQSQKPQSAIHKRLHKSMSDELRMFGELVHDFMPARYDYSIGGDAQFLRKADFNGHVDVVSVTDPNIYSNTQRIQQAQAIDQTMTQHPDLFTPKKRVAAVIRMFEALKIPDIEDIKPEADTPKYLDATSENTLLMRGKGVRAYETQDHAAHMEVHKQGAATVAASPMEPQTQQAIMAGYGVHIRDHMALQYRQLIMAAAGIPPPPLDNEGEPVELPPDVEARITAAVVARLPPPPAPPQPPPDPNAPPPPMALAQQKLAANQMLAKGKAEDHSNAAQHDDERKTQAFLKDEARKEAAHKSNLRRIAEQTQAESKRQDALTASQVVREGARAGVQRKLDAAGKLQEVAHAHASSRLTLTHQAATAQQKLKDMKDQAEVTRKANVEKARAAKQAARDALQQKREQAKIKPASKAKP